MRNKNKGLKEYMSHWMLKNQWSEHKLRILVGIQISGSEPCEPQPVTVLVLEFY